jgi:hypothetical protein
MLNKPTPASPVNYDTATMGFYQPPDGVTNLKYNLLYFLTPNKKNSKRKALAFNRDSCCHLALCLWLISFHYGRKMLYIDAKI